MAKNYLKPGDHVSVTNVDFVVDDNGSDLIEPNLNKRNIEYYNSDTSEYYPVLWDQSFKPARMYWED